MQLRQQAVAITGTQIENIKEKRLSITFNYVKYYENM